MCVPRQLNRQTASHTRAAVGVSVHGGAGNDEIEATLGRRTRHELDAGPGRRDIVRLTATKADFGRGASFVVDVSGESVRVDGRKRLVWQDVEELRFDGPGGHLTYFGGPGSDSLYANRQMRVRAWGRGGSDNLVGGTFADLLDGGPGRDHLLGEAGRDRCLNGEQVRQCETRR